MLGVLSAAQMRLPLGLPWSLSQHLQRIATSAQVGYGIPAGGVLPRSLDVFSNVYIQSADRMAGLNKRMREELAVVRQGGGDVATSRHRARGKMLPRERIDQLLDEGSPFLELSPLAGKGLYGEAAVRAWQHDSMQPPAALHCTIAAPPHLQPVLFMHMRCSQ
jgi:3-methylcrotonyl-CoA carboxylase beta subunit